MMKNKIRNLMVSIMLMAAITVLTGASDRESQGTNVSGDSFACTIITPGLLRFGTRTDDEEQFLEILNDGAWSAQVNAPWISINGQSTLSSDGDATVGVTITGVVPPGIPSEPCITTTTGTIAFYGCSGTFLVRVRFVNCSCC